MNGAEYVIAFLKAQGVERIYTVSGGMIAPLLDAADRAGIHLVTCMHEQAAGFAAQGEAIYTGRPAVAMATSGPGATNLLTPIASCYFDGTPAIFITGQVPTNEQRGFREVRQLGFQEMDADEMVQGVTKWTASLDLRSVANISGILDLAWRHALAGRPGPVLLDLPFDVQRMELPARVEAPAPLLAGWQLAPPHDLLAKAQTALGLLRKAKRPLVLVGNGARCPTLAPALDALGIPVVSSLLGRDVYPGSVGMIGSYGNRWANKALAECDVLLVLGSRLDVRQVGAAAARFAKGKTIIRVDVDRGEMRDGHVSGDLLVEARVGDFLRALDLKLREEGGTTVFGRSPSAVPWRAEIAAWRERWPAETELATAPGYNPNDFFARLQVPAACAFVVDVGAHQMWAAQSLRLGEGQRFITSGGHGAMGFALPAAVGVALASKRPVVVIVGDGSFQVNVHELATIRRLSLPVKILVLDNAGHGMVRGFQDQLFGGRHVATAFRHPDPARIAAAYGIDAAMALRRHRAGPFVAEGPWHLLEGPEPALVHLPLPSDVGVAPKLMYGRGLDDMEPEKR